MGGREMIHSCVFSSHDFKNFQQNCDIVNKMKTNITKLAVKEKKLIILKAIAAASYEYSFDQ